MPQKTTIGKVTTLEGPSHEDPKPLHTHGFRIEDLKVAEEETPRTEPAKAQPLYTANMEGQELYIHLCALNVCGTPYANMVDYDLEVTTRGLDDRGFSFDSNFPSAIEDKYRNAPALVASCEQVAGLIMRHALKEAGDRAVKLVVRIYTGAGKVVVEWEQGQELPPKPRVATEEEIRQHGIKKAVGCGRW